MRAAISARSSKRIRVIRSAFRSAASLQAQGPRSSRRAIATALDWKAASRPSPVAFWSTKTTTPTATSDSPATTAAPLRPLASRIPAPQSAAGQISESEKPKPRRAIAPASPSVT